MTLFVRFHLTSGNPEGTQQSPTPTATVAPHLTLPPDEARKCDSTGWTRWFNMDSPDGSGDIESLPEIRRVNPICAEDFVTKVPGTEVPYCLRSALNTR